MDISQLLNNPMLQNISSEKLKLLQELSQQNPGNTPQQMAASLQSASNTAKEKGVQFTQDDTDLLFQVLTQNMTESERQKANMIRMMMKRKA